MQYHLDRKLTTEELKCLKYIHKGKLDYSNENNCRMIDTLFMYGLVSCSMDIEGVLDYTTSKLSSKGKSYLEESITNKKRYIFSETRSWIAIIVSVCALLFSIFYK